MTARPFLARWQLGPLVGGRTEGRLALDDDAWFAGHYPGVPIFPGSFLVEAVLEAASLVLPAELRLETLVSCRFRTPLLPGDVLTASFAVRAAAAGRVLVEVTARGRAPVAELTMRLGPLPSPATAEREPSPAPSGRMLEPGFVRAALPHRPPALLVDEGWLLASAPPALLARKTLAADEACFGRSGGGGLATYPVTLVLESFCQACGLLRAANASEEASRDDREAPVVAKLAGLRVLGEACPGDTLEHHVELLVRSEDGAVFAGHTTAGGRRVLEVARVVAAHARLAATRDRPP